jgi:ribonucleoside-diphosphate reductase alpha chain
LDNKFSIKRFWPRLTTLVEHTGELNVSDVKSQEDLNERAAVAAFFGTLQAGFTDFHYLRPIWSKTTQKDALLGIGQTGIASGEVLKYKLDVAVHQAKLMNSITSELIGTSEAARITCIKPSGTTSLVLGTSSGIHAWHNDYYLRTMRFNKNEDIAAYLMVNHPELCEDDQLRPTDTLCVRIPVKAPEGSILRTETAIDTLERVKKFSKEWILPGHVSGENTHNVSATISIDKNRLYYPEWSKEDPTRLNYLHNNQNQGSFDEWEVVGQWMWDNKEFYNGLSVLPYFGGSFIQAPFEDITKEEYERRIESVKEIDLTKVIEMDDTVDFGAIAACAGGQCSIE